MATNFPNLLAESDLRQPYEHVVREAQAGFRTADRGQIPEAATAQYVLPLGTRCRSLSKMDFAEALHICRAASAPQGHISYRRVAWETIRRSKKVPGTGQEFRVTDVNVPVDPLQR